MLGIGDVLALYDTFSQKRLLKYQVAKVEDQGYELDDDDRPSSSPFKYGNTAIIKITNAGREVILKSEIGSLRIISEGIQHNGSGFFNRINHISLLDILEVDGIEIRELDRQTVNVSFEMLNPNDFFYIVLNYDPVGHHALYALKGTIAGAKIRVERPNQKKLRKLWEHICQDERCLNAFINDNPSIIEA
jgi:hypothetical protein